MMNEFEIINKYLSPLSIKNKGSYNLKNDIFYDYKKKLAVSVDTYIEKKHFLNFTNPLLVIKKIFRSALSDLICKGITPKYYFISSSGNKKSFSKKKLSLIMRALRSEQKKYNVTLVGGDTTKSNVLSFTFIMIGYSENPPKKRNNVKNNDDIYVTGNLGDSFVGLSILKKKIKCNKKDKAYFVKSYYLPILHTKFSKSVKFLANSSIDISDGLFQDLKHLFYKNKFTHNIDSSKIPISNKLKLLLNKKKMNKMNLISKGDDYQILFTCRSKYRKHIMKLSKKCSTKVTRIGIVKSLNSKTLTNSDKNIGYIHKF